MNVLVTVSSEPYPVLKPAEHQRRPPLHRPYTAVTPFPFQLAPLEQQAGDYALLMGSSETVMPGSQRTA